ncbi:MAG: Gfo/Idh/MocA family oxidoreductase [Armatimonadetes bacterium]|nr:Gfo/Idh/MocA family oxidoreductase [Armatimonadota bacterium]
MARYRVAVVGAGGIARHHAGYYTADERTEIVAAADIDPQRLTEYCDLYSVPGRYADYRELLEKERPDVVSVCTWQDTHPAITLAAAESGAKAVLCEKPMGVALGEVEEAVRACEERGVTLVVHHQTRFGPNFAAARGAVAEGLIGKPQVFLAHCQAGLLNIGSHVIDIARYVLGDPRCAWVLGQAERKTNRYERGVICEDLCQAIVGLDNGARIAIDLDMPDTATKQNRSLIGSEGMMRFDGDVTYVLRGGSGGWEALPTEPQPGFLEEFIAWIEGGPESRCAGKHGLAEHEVLCALYESSMKRELVRLPSAYKGFALAEMVTDGSMPAGGEAYDIRSEAALRRALG